MFRRTGLALLVVATIGVGALAQTRAKPVDLPMGAMLKESGRGLESTDSLRKLDGHRVRLKGFMAQMEEPPKGGFWLVPRPVFQDESGGGTGDLPPNSVFVIVRSSPSKSISYLPGGITVTGTLKLSNKSPRISLVLDSSKEIGIASKKGLKRR